MVALGLALIAFAGGSWWGYRSAGPLGGLFGALLGTAIAALTVTIARAMSAAGRYGERPAPDVRELPPEQAIEVLSAMMGAGASEARGGQAAPDMGGGLLTQIRKARARAAAGDLDGAAAKLRELADAHPRSPAAPAALARVLRGEDQHDAERRRWAGRAIALAIHGGMNRLAAQVFEELDESEHDALELEDTQWRQLGKIFSARGDEANATRCRCRER